MALVLLAFARRLLPRAVMLASARATIAAAAYAYVTGKKVAGIFDHAEGRHRRIAAESRGDHLQGYDGERSTRFGGTLPELFDAGTGQYVSMTIDGGTAKGYDRASATAYTACVTAVLVQVYDHGAAEWFAFAVQVA